MSSVREMAVRAREAARSLGQASAKQKNAALLAMADSLIASTDDLIAENDKDVAAARERGMSAPMLDRLTLTPQRVADIAEGLRQITHLPDPVGETLDGWTRPNGLQIQRVRVPLGVIGIIYESRPNVTADAAGLCLKSGNACLLRGGSEALNSNSLIASKLSSAAESVGLPAHSIQLIASPDREAARELMRMNGLVDVLIPRGGAGLIQSVIENATVPVIETGTGNCHIYVDGSADLDSALQIIVNAKCSRPSVCNAVETVLIHSVIAEEFLPILAAKLSESSVEIRGCERTREVAAEVGISTAIVPATEEDWHTEYSGLILAVKIVDSLDEALTHIHTYGTRHSESIITEDYTSSQRFLSEVDAACVYVNASTRFSDGFEFGFGAEIGISNQKLHARGPMGLRELTTYKYIIRGEGQTRE
jgi:glutamate-5-semialdehyde dehydrogenase